MEESELVSVIMSEYNTDQVLLEKSISSILKQSYKNIELIIIDDCGNNNLKELLGHIKDNRLKIIKNKKNMGLVNSLNLAIANCKGNYIARMDTDDYSYPSRIEKQIGYMKKHPEYDLIASRCDIYDGEKIWGESKKYGEIKRNDLLNGNPIIHPTVMYKKEAIQKIGGYQNFQRCEDYATWIELFINGGRIYIIDDKLIKYHLSIDDYNKRSIKHRVGILKMIKHQYIKLRPSKKQLIKMYSKNIIAGILPYKIMSIYHRKKLEK